MEALMPRSVNATLKADWDIERAFKNADKIVENAQEKHQKEFELWVGKYYSE